MSNIPLIKNAREKWEDLDSREQLSLKVLSIVLACFIAYFAVWQPAKNYMSSEYASLEQSQELLQLIRNNRQKLASVGQRSNNQPAAMNSQQLVSTVTNLAKKNALSLKRFEPSGDNKVKVWLEDAPFDKMVEWLAQLEKNLKVRVEQISVEKEDAPGMISARLTLSS